jgi:hypothetical protein
MDSFSFPIFTFISAFVRFEFNHAMDAAYGRFVHSISLIAVGIEVVFLTRYAFLIAFNKNTSVETRGPNLRELMYHACIFMFMLAMIEMGKLPLEVLMAFREMLTSGLTGSDTPAGKQAAMGLYLMDLAFSSLNVVHSTAITNDDSAKSKETTVMLGLAAQVSPQIMGSVMLLVNEMIVRVGMALCPLMVYFWFYDATRAIALRWFQRMVGFSMQMATLAIMVTLSAGVVTAYSLTFTAFVIATRLLPPGVGYYISELQESVISASLGFTLTLLFIWFPHNAGLYGGDGLYAGTSSFRVGDRGASLAKKSQAAKVFGAK